MTDTASNIVSAAVGERPRTVRPGRPRDSSVEARVFEAVLALLRECSSYEEVTTRAIARRAGAGLGAIYRRWATREELLVAALNSVRSIDGFEWGDDFVDNILRIMQVAGAGVSAEAAEALRIRIQLGFQDPRIQRISAERHRNRRRRLLVEAVERGITSGQVQLTIPVDHFVDAVIGTVTYRYIVPLDPGDSPADALRSLLRLVAVPSR